MRDFRRGLWFVLSPFLRSAEPFQRKLSFKPASSEAGFFTLLFRPSSLAFLKEKAVLLKYQYILCAWLPFMSALQCPASIPDLLALRLEQALARAQGATRAERLRWLMACHRIQDLQSLWLHEVAVAAMLADPAAVAQVSETLERWLVHVDVRTLPLLLRWKDILERQAWSEALAGTDEAQQLRQASPLGAALPAGAREAVLAFVGNVKNEARSTSF